MAGQPGQAGELTSGYVCPRPLSTLLGLGALVEGGKQPLTHWRNSHANRFVHAAPPNPDLDWRGGLRPEPSGVRSPCGGAAGGGHPGAPSHACARAGVWPIAWPIQWPCAWPHPWCLWLAPGGGRSACRLAAASALAGARAGASTLGARPSPRPRPCATARASPRLVIRSHGLEAVGKHPADLVQLVLAMQLHLPLALGVAAGTDAVFSMSFTTNPAIAPRAVDPRRVQAAR
jgi:hypothetical protein